MKMHPALRVGTAVFLFSAAKVACANPIVGPDLWLLTYSPVMLLVPVIGMLAEYLAVRLLLHNWLPPRVILRNFLVINLITYPAAELLSTIVSWPAEVLPLIVEPILYAGVARRAGVKIPRLGLRIVGANVWSFAVGIFMIIALAPMAQSYR